MAKLDIKQQLKILLEIQEYDSQIMELEMRKAYYPSLLNNLKNEIAQINDEYKSNSERQRQLKSEINTLEDDIAITKENLKRSQEKLRNVSTNKEYDAVQMEIQYNEEKIATLEEKLMILLEEQERLDKLVKDLSEKLEEVEKTNTEKIDSLEKSSLAIDEVINEVKAKRDALATQIGQPILRRYEQIRRGAKGTAVVPIVNRACGGCHQALPPQVIQEIRAGKIINCENCGRILVEVEDFKIRKE